MDTVILIYNFDFFYVLKCVSNLHLS